MLKSYCSHKQKCTMTEKLSFYMLSFNAHLADNKDIYYIFDFTYTNFCIVLCRKKSLFYVKLHTQNIIYELKCFCIVPNIEYVKYCSDRAFLWLYDINLWQDIVFCLTICIRNIMSMLRVVKIHTNILALVVRSISLLFY